MFTTINWSYWSTRSTRLNNIHGNGTAQKRTNITKCDVRAVELESKLYITSLKYQNKNQVTPIVYYWFWVQPLMVIQDLIKSQ